MDRVHGVVHGPGPQGWSMDPGPCFVYVRKYPYPHHGGNWKFQRGGGVKGPGNSGEEGGLLVNLRFLMVKFDAMQICFKIVSYLL